MIQADVAVLFEIRCSEGERIEGSTILGGFLGLWNAGGCSLPFGRRQWRSRTVCGTLLAGTLTGPGTLIGTSSLWDGIVLTLVRSANAIMAYRTSGVATDLPRAASKHVNNFVRSGRGSLPLTTGDDQVGALTPRRGRLCWGSGGGGRRIAFGGGRSLIGVGEHGSRGALRGGIRRVAGIGREPAGGVVGYVEL